MDIVHQFEQMQAVLRDFSPLLWTYYLELQAQGFTQQQAFELVKNYQNTTFGAKQ
ncbi:hypothetical protein [Planococcus citreus]|uniref:Uncharacterized protein n=1 Tax=Planococcus citreus TaxID=1373 RepID=A0A497YI29_9BACL|nr:hypothetical protein [Planococcus citreus]RLJ90139.1 hypothetical protein DFR62_0281 [Planococcus citreus]